MIALAAIGAGVATRNPLDERVLAVKDVSQGSQPLQRSVDHLSELLIRTIMKGDVAGMDHEVSPAGMLSWINRELETDKKM